MSLDPEPLKGTVRTPSVASGRGYRLQTAHWNLDTTGILSGNESTRGQEGLQPHLMRLDAN